MESRTGPAEWQPHTYGLVHPNSEAVYAANWLWHHFGQEPDFRITLDELYEGSTGLLDHVSDSLHPVSSLADAGRLWHQLEAGLSDSSQPPELSTQAQCLKVAVEKRGLRCPWASYSLLYTLGSEYRGVVLLVRAREEEKRRGIPVTNPDVSPEMMAPRWQGSYGRVHSGFIDPNVGGYGGTDFVLADGTNVGTLAEGGPAFSFYDAGPEGFEIPDGVSESRVEAEVEDWRQRNEKVQKMYEKRGMVRPKQRRQGPSLDEKLKWLFMDLTHPKWSWADKTKRINQGREGQVFEDSTIASHVNELRESLLIERLPGRKPQFG